MNKTLKKIIFILAMLVVAIILKPGETQAASATISANSTKVTPGQTVTVTGKVTAGAWNLTLSGAGQSAKILGQTSQASNETASKNISFTAGNIGTKYTITLAGGMTDFNESEETSVNKSITIEVIASDSGNTGGTSGGDTSTQKSNNASLKNLGIKPNDFSRFKPSKISYDVTVSNDVESIEVYASKGQSGQTIAGTGKKNLKEGANSFAVTVTAEDGKTKKTYTINVTRQSAGREGNEGIESVFGLAQLKIDAMDLEPAFMTDIYEYKLKLIGTQEKLSIDADATEANAKVEITGNENLKDGENIITILVTDETGEKTATYQITVDKSLIDEDAFIKQQEEQKKQEKIKKMIFLGVVILVAIGFIITIILIRRRKNQEYEEDFQMPFANLNKEEQDEQNKEENEKDDEKEKVPENKGYRDIREEFLSQTNNLEYEEEEEELKRKKHNKGKRFK